MVDRAISADALLAAGSIATGDLVPLVDISEVAAADRNKHTTFANLVTYFASNLNAVMDADFSAAEGMLRKVSAGTYTTIKTNLNASTNPTPDEDSGDGYGLGSIWINTTADRIYVCLDATVANAYWVELGREVFDNTYFRIHDSINNFNLDFNFAFSADRTITLPDADVVLLKHNLVSVTSPTANDDALLGYDIGSIWVNTAIDVAYICVDATNDVAVWEIVTPTTALLNKYDATSAPTVNDDINDGYTVGSQWVNLSTNRAYICLSSTVGAAVWKETTPPLDYPDGSFNIVDDLDGTKKLRFEVNAITTATTRTIIVPNDNVFLHQDNLSGGDEPTSTDDSAQGYSVGSRWFNLVDDVEYVCLDATPSAAVWKITSVLAGTFTPTILDDTLSDAESQTYTARTGVYRKSDDMVYFWIDITVNSLGTLTTTQAAKIGGLPYTSKAAGSGGVTSAVTVGFGTSLAITAGNSVSGFIGTNVAYIDLWKWSAATGSSALLLSELSTGGQLVLSGSYLV